MDTASLARRAQRQCFVVPRRLDPPPRSSDVGLPDRSAAALAQLLPLLGCGEEAAAIAFDGLAARHPEAEDHDATLLRAIAEEERVHDALIRHLRNSLPELACDPQALAAARHFHLAANTGGPAFHFARIAALDSAVCLVLARLLRAGSPIGADGVVATVLRRIQRDEARHVRVSRAMATRAGVDRRTRDVAAEARAALADMLALASAPFEALAVDPAALDRAVRQLPDGLLAG